MPFCYCKEVAEGGEGGSQSYHVWFETGLRGGNYHFNPLGHQYDFRIKVSGLLIGKILEH